MSPALWFAVGYAAGAWTVLGLWSVRWLLRQGHVDLVLAVVAWAAVLGVLAAFVWVIVGWSRRQ